MPEQTRETLYKHFSAGQLPTEAHFRDLVDSMLNMQSEGFRKTPEYGMQVMSAAGKTALLSFYRDHAPTSRAGPCTSEPRTTACRSTTARPATAATSRC